MEAQEPGHASTIADFPVACRSGFVFAILVPPLTVKISDTAGVRCLFKFGMNRYLVIPRCYLHERGPIAGGLKKADILHDFPSVFGLEFLYYRRRWCACLSNAREPPPCLAMRTIAARGLQVYKNRKRGESRAHQESVIAVETWSGSLGISPLGQVGGVLMISMIVEFALFFLVLFVVVPGVMIAWAVVRELIRQHRKPAGWHKSETTKLAS